MNFLISFCVTTKARGFLSFAAAFRKGRTPKSMLQISAKSVHKKGFKEKKSRRADKKVRTLFTFPFLEPKNTHSRGAGQHARSHNKAANSGG
jgi:hypothetical protein